MLHNFTTKHPGTIWYNRYTLNYILKKNAMKEYIYIIFMDVGFLSRNIKLRDRYNARCKILRRNYAGLSRKRDRIKVRYKRFVNLRREERFGARPRIYKICNILLPDSARGRARWIDAMYKRVSDALSARSGISKLHPRRKDRSDARSAHAPSRDRGGRVNVSSYLFLIIARGIYGIISPWVNLWPVETRTNWPEGIATPSLTFLILSVIFQSGNIVALFLAN